MNSRQSERLRAQPIVDLEAYLLGSWHLSREIIDHGRDRLYLSGSAEVRRCDDGTLGYLEKATLASSQNPIDFTRSYLFRPTGATTAIVEFDDGSMFYDLDLRSGRGRVRHLCDQDLYLGFILTTPNGWYTRWRCTGPQKDYVATTYLSPEADLSQPSK